MDVNSFPVPVNNLDPDLRNGVFSALVPATRAASIPVQYYYVPVTKDCAATDCIEVYVRTYYARLCAHYITPEAIAARDADAADTDSIDAGVIAAGANARLRLEAIALGAARASIEACFTIVDGDISVNERVPDSIFTVVTQAFTGARTFAVTRTANNQALAAEEILGLRMPALTPDEWSFVYNVVNLAKASPVLAGCQLSENGHHYLSSVLAPTLAVEKQIVQSLDPTDIVVATWNSNIPMLRDVIWHKSSHPVASVLLKQLCQSAEVAKRFEACGLGSVAVRLPYVESRVRAVEAMVGIADQVETSISSAGHSVKIPTLRLALQMLRTHGYSETADYDIVDVGRATGRSAFVDTVLPTIIARTEPICAWQIGWFKNVLSEAGVATSRNTLLTARSVARIVGSHGVSASDGAMYHGLWLKTLKKSVDTDSLIEIKLSV